MSDKAYSAYLIDLDGTLYRGNQPIPHAKEFIQTLRRLNVPFLFITNNSTTRPEVVAERLRVKFGIDARDEEVYTSALATADYLQKQQAKTAYVIGEEGLHAAIKQAGVVETKNNPEYVVVGLHRSVTYQDVEEAALAIQNGATYVLTNADTNYPTERGLLPGAGSIGAMVEVAGRKKPIVIGKPGKNMITEALDQLKVSADETLMVGDNLDTDILAGQQSGVDTLMVLTGVSTLEDALQRKEKPTYIREHLGEWDLQ